MRGLIALLAVGALSAALLAVSAPGAGSSAATKTYRFRVVAVTHNSSSSKNEAPVYTGSSTSKWHLAAATRRAPNTIGITIGPGFITGVGYINVKGVFTAHATSNRPGGSCQLTAATGSKQYPAVAPGRFPLSVGPDFKKPSRAAAGIGPGGDVYATLGNPYFPSECSTSLTGEPDPDTSSLVYLPKTVFTHRLVTLRYVGSTSDSGITYHWSTIIKLKRIVKHR